MTTTNPHVEAKYASSKIDTARSKQGAVKGDHTSLQGYCKHTSDLDVRNQCRLDPVGSENPPDYVRITRDTSRNLSGVTLNNDTNETLLIQYDDINDHVDNVPACISTVSTFQASNYHKQLTCSNKTPVNNTSLVSLNRSTKRKLSQLGSAIPNFFNRKNKLQRTDSALKSLDTSVYDKKKPCTPRCTHSSSISKKVIVSKLKGKPKIVKRSTCKLSSGVNSRCKIASQSNIKLLPDKVSVNGVIHPATINNNKDGYKMTLDVSPTHTKNVARHNTTKEVRHRNNTLVVDYDEHARNVVLTEGCRNTGENSMYRSLSVRDTDMTQTLPMKLSAKTVRRKDTRHDSMRLKATPSKLLSGKQGKVKNVRQILSSDSTDTVSLKQQAMNSPHSTLVANESPRTCHSNIRTSSETASQSGNSGDQLCDENKQTFTLDKHNTVPAGLFASDSDKPLKSHKEYSNTGGLVTRTECRSIGQKTTLNMPTRKHSVHSTSYIHNMNLMDMKLGPENTTLDEIDFNASVCIETVFPAKRNSTSQMPNVKSLQVPLEVKSYQDRVNCLDKNVNHDLKGYRELHDNKHDFQSISNSFDRVDSSSANMQSKQGGNANANTTIPHNTSIESIGKSSRLGLQKAAPQTSTPIPRTSRSSSHIVQAGMNRAGRFSKVQSANNIPHFVTSTPLAKYTSSGVRRLEQMKQQQKNTADKKEDAQLDGRKTSLESSFSSTPIKNSGPSTSTPRTNTTTSVQNLLPSHLEEGKTKTRTKSMRTSQSVKSGMQTRQVASRKSPEVELNFTGKQVHVLSNSVVSDTKKSGIPQGTKSNQARQSSKLPLAGGHSKSPTRVTTKSSTALSGVNKSPINTRGLQEQNAPSNDLVNNDTASTFYTPDSSLSAQDGSQLSSNGCNIVNGSVVGGENTGVVSEYKDLDKEYRLCGNCSMVIHVSYEGPDKFIKSSSTDLSKQRFNKSDTASTGKNNLSFEVAKGNSDAQLCENCESSLLSIRNCNLELSSADKSDICSITIESLKESPRVLAGSHKGSTYNTVTDQNNSICSSVLTQVATATSEPPPRIPERIKNGRSSNLGTSSIKKNSSYNKATRSSSGLRRTTGTTTLPSQVHLHVGSAVQKSRSETSKTNRTRSQTDRSQITVEGRNDISNLGTELVPGNEVERDTGKEAIEGPNKLGMVLNKDSDMSEPGPSTPYSEKEKMQASAEGNPVAVDRGAAEGEGHEAVCLRTGMDRKRERPKSDCNVKWAESVEDNENQLEQQVKSKTNVVPRKTSGNRPRPKSDLGGAHMISEAMRLYDQKENVHQAINPTIAALSMEDKRAKSRRMSTPHPIKNRVERSPPKQRRPMSLVRTRSAPDLFDQAIGRRRRNKDLDTSLSQHAGELAILDNSKHYSSDESDSENSLSGEMPGYHPRSPTEHQSRPEMFDDDSLTYAEALWDHVTMDPEELGFRAGDVIEVTDMSDKDWWWGVMEEQEGWFPAAFVRLRANQEDTAEEFVEKIREGTVDTKAVMRRYSVSFLSKDQARTNVVNEIISAEREYVRNLKDVIQGYVRQAKKHSEMFSEHRISVMFGNIEEIYKLSQDLLRKLDKSYNSDLPHLSELGHCFLQQSRGFEMYSEYCNNHPFACEELKEIQKDRKYRHFFEACRLLQHMIEIPLEGFLLTPVQKICKYPLQLAELLKYTRPEHRDYKAVKEALETMRNIATFINERKRRIESIDKLAAWQRNVLDWEGPHLLQTSSELIYSGEVHKVTSSGWSQERMFFLFDHQLIYCKKDLLKRDVYCYKERINMDHCKVIPIEDGKVPQYGMIKNGWKLHDSDKDKWWLLHVKTLQQKTKWLKAFTDERHRVLQDQESGFKIPEHARQVAMKTKQKKSLPNKPDTYSPRKLSRVPQSLRQELLLELPDLANKIPQELTLSERLASKTQLIVPEQKKRNWFLFSGKKSKR